MKVVELLEAKKAKDGAILKGGFILEKDTLNGAENIWVLKRMLEDEELAEACIIQDSILGPEYRIFKIVSYVTGKKQSTHVRAGSKGKKMDKPTFQAAVEQRFFDWVESKVNDPGTELLR